MQKVQSERSKMLGTMPLKRLIPQISVPIMISMLVQALYNVVDSIFVAQYDANALTAVSLAYPIQMLMIAVSTGLGTGINSLISRRLGEKRSEEARVAAWNGIFLSAIGALMFVVFGLFFTRSAFHAMTGDATLQEMGTTYLSIVTTFCFGLFMAIVFERMTQSTGNTMLSMITQMVGAITNIILDPIMIFGLLGCPEMGIAGAAIATVIGQFCSMLTGFVLNQTRNRELHLHLPEFRIHMPIIRDILAVGFPSMIMASISSVMTLALNAILTRYGNTPISVLGIYFKLQSFVFMPVFGLSNGMVAILAYNFGARSRSRVYEGIRISLYYALGLMAVGMLAFMLIPHPLMRLFEKGENMEMTLMGIPALRTISLCFLPAAVGISLSTVFQSVGKGTYSLIVSLSRQLLVLLPSAWLLSEAFGTVSAVWWSFPIAELVSFVISLLMYRRVNRKMLQPLEE